MAPGRALASGKLQVYRQALALAVGLQFRRCALALFERSRAGAFDRAKANESIIAASLGCDKTIGHDGVEEFYGSGDHMEFLCPICDRNPPTVAHSGFVRLERNKGDLFAPISIIATSADRL